VRRAAACGPSPDRTPDSIRGAAVGDGTVPEIGLGTAVHALFRPFGGVELEPPPREPMREPPGFD